MPPGIAAWAKAHATELAQSEWRAWPALRQIYYFPLVITLYERPFLSGSLA
jgi:hypothetical protein